MAIKPRLFDGARGGFRSPRLVAFLREAGAG